MGGWGGGWGLTGPLAVQSREGRALKAFGLQGRARWGLLSTVREADTGLTWTCLGGKATRAHGAFWELHPKIFN